MLVFKHQYQNLNIEVYREHRLCKYNVMHSKQRGYCGMDILKHDFKNVENVSFNKCGRSRKTWAVGEE